MHPPPRALPATLPQDRSGELLAKLLDAYPQQTMWALAPVSRSVVRSRQEAGSAILLRAKRGASDAGK